MSNTESALETDTAQRCAAVGKVIRETGIQIEDFAILPQTTIEKLAAKFNKDIPAQVMLTRLIDAQVRGGKPASATPPPAAPVVPLVRRAEDDGRTLFEQMLGELESQESGPTGTADLLAAFPGEWFTSCLPRGDVVITTIRCATKMQGRFFPGADIPKEFFPGHIKFEKKDGKVNYGSYPNFQEVLIRMLCSLVPIKDYPVVNLRSIFAYVHTTSIE